jgi:hypothetical protein
VTGIPQPPEGVTEHPPMGPNELTRWRYPTSAGDVTFALLSDPPRVQWWTGPGHAECETDDPEALWRLSVVFEVLGNWVSDLTRLSRAPESRDPYFVEAPAGG